MNPYLTLKGEKGKMWYWLMDAVCGFLAVFFLTLLPGCLLTKDRFRPALCLGLLTVFLCPVIWHIKSLLLRKQAQKIARWFAYCREDTVSFGRLSRETEPDIERTIDRLLKAGYLKNLLVDYKQGLVRLKKHGEAAQAHIREEWK